ncbi:MAG: EamA family transporter [Alphaproteobacteria bacterium]|nr:EamA family transporter [Alphaproteobacteria bacterium]
MIRPALPALASALLFGASTPFAKLLLGEVGPQVLAGLLYLGSGLGLAALLAGRRLGGRPAAESPLRLADLPWLIAVVLTGGVAAPLLLMIGLATTPASAAALMLNLEGLATLGIAWAVFRESVDRRLLLGAFAILAGAALLSWQPDGGGAGAAGWGAVAIAAACLAWGVDNNLTRRLSGADPVQLAAVKGLVAGVVNLTIGLALGGALPAVPVLAGAAVVGLLGYGASLVLFILGLRTLGTARTGAYFSTAPFLGALLAVTMLGEPASWQLGASALLMAVGLWLHLAERHEHRHEHQPIEHEHAHSHDEHHQHHEGETPPGPHAHRHTHDRLPHKHPHHPDLHHRHGHSKESP